MLDTETDFRLRSDIHDTLNSMLQTLAAHNLTHWLGLCRDVLSASKSSKGAKGGGTQERETEEGDMKTDPFNKSSLLSCHSFLQ